MQTLKIVNDYDATNPRTDRDCLPSLITKWWRYYWDKEYLINVIDFVQKKLNKKNIYAIAEALWYDKDDVKKEKLYYSNKTSFEVVQDWIYELNHIDDIEKILDILKVKNYRRTSRGYSQWDCLDCLLIATDEYIQENWLNKKDIEFKTEAKLFDAREWGDVYWFQIIEQVALYKENGSLHWYVDGEIVESCYWYYGDDGLDTIKSEVANYWITKEQFENAKDNLFNL